MTGRDRPLRVMALGFRGFPGVQGGVSRVHAENLYPRLAKLGCAVEAVMRTQSVPADIGKALPDLTVTRLFAPAQSGIEALVHTFLGTVLAAVRRPDVLHIHAIGPALMTPLARLLGLRVVVTHHSLNYEHQKWGTFAKVLLRLGEAAGMRFANEVIVVSRTLRDLVRDKYGRTATVIPNGVSLPEVPTSRAALDAHGLEPGRYVLTVGRIVSEKRPLDMIEAFARAQPAGWKLVLVGAADHHDAYAEQVERAVADTPNVVACGYQSGLALRELYAHAGLFVLPSAHEGMPIALLEALSYGLPVIASDIPANTELGLPDACYFPVGDVAALAAALGRSEEGASADSIRHWRQWLRDRYDWDDIAARTLSVISAAARHRREPHARKATE